MLLSNGKPIGGRGNVRPLRHFQV